MEIRNADISEIAILAQLWYDAWQDAHADLMPAELIKIRTVENFRERLKMMRSDVRVAGDIGHPLGFHIVKDEELYQLFVSRDARGTGVAAALIADAESILHKNGVKTAWLACAIGNERAARFYEKSGWKSTGILTNILELSTGPYELDVWRFEKPLA